MEKKTIHLANGDLLTRTEEGTYHITHDGNNITSRIIEREEGEYLLFETVEQLKMSLEAWVENSTEWQRVAEKYGTALVEIAEVDHGDLEQTEIAIKALEKEDEDDEC